MDVGILNDLINSTEEAILIFEGAGNITFSNARANRLLGAGESVVDRDIRNLLNSSTMRIFEKEFFNLVQKELPFVYFNTIVDKEASNNLRVRIKPFRGDSFVVTFTALEKSEPFNAYQLYKLLAENAYDINLMFNDHELIYVSPSIYDFLGYFDNEITTIGQWFSLIHPEDIERVKRELEDDKKDKIPYSFISYRQKHKKGNYLWFETKIRHEFLEDGSTVNILTSMDITKRKKAEVQLEKQKEFIEELFDSDPNLIFVKDGRGRIIYCNKAVADLVGIPRDEFLAMENNQFPAPKHDLDIYEDMESKVINLGQEILIEEKIEDKNGIVNHFQTIKKPLKTKDGDVNILNISTNINQIKYYQHESNKAMVARTEFFSAMSHEIRTPMNAIMGMADLLLKRKPREDQVKLLEALHFSSKNLLNLINDVLDFSKIEAGKIEVEEINFNLKNLVDNIYLSLKPKALSKDLSLGLLFDENVPHIVKGDSIKITQILNNLIGNAIKFTEEGNVSIYVNLIERNEDGYIVKLRIVDTGIGIPQDKINDIFNPFQQASASTTRKFGGTGLGLTIVKNLVKILDGQIEVSSTEEKGSAFEVALPLKQADGKKIEHTGLSTSIQELKWKLDLNILYVEDVITNQFLLEEILKEWGVTVDLASNGKAAIDKISSKKYDMVLMDIQMPDMDGYSACRYIRNMEDEYFKKVPILALTANTSKSTKSQISKVGMQDYIIKPINVNELRSKIIKYSKLSDEIDLSLLKDEITLESPVITSINYQQTDNLFLSNMVKYQDFLKKTISEFDLNLQEMIQSMKARDLEAFRKIHHRMKSIVAMLNMGDLSSVIEDIKAKLATDEPDLDIDSEIKNLKYQFDFVRDNLTNKLSSLKWH